MLMLMLMLMQELAQIGCRIYNLMYCTSSVQHILLDANKHFEGKK